MPPRALDYTIVDAFTTEPFKGNPASVIALPSNHNLPDTTLQDIAKEFNLSATAFITLPEPQEDCSTLAKAPGLRWFAPQGEVAICGHATLAAAYVLLCTRSIDLTHVNNVVRFNTMSGVVTAALLLPAAAGDYAAEPRIELDFPSGEVHAVDSEFLENVKTVVARAFNSGSDSVVRFAGRGEGVSFGIYLLVEVDEEKLQLEGAAVDTGVFAELAPYRIIIITSRSKDPDTAFISRVFCPLLGVAEDPVSGSTHSLSGPYWRARLSNVQEGQEMKARQVGGRVGEIGVIWDEQNSRCRLRGAARITAKGELYL
ncbi:hypothetical protein BOTBODRAFT_54616 [Botryobasidium botryosum FD-172 SS1]|uniref:Uncharacterized protein n=1 Tax=Botryobasidium botryosum (strain FD-172 SS1) TaxID=930990 RepID=A0A067MJM4_BOTB1|nr:hypothetical protein BOTBODRAFT_54616 [Botryobasidium botryosum FD-172 SS1]